MAKLLREYEWNDRFYAVADLDDGTRIELKSKDGKDFDALLVRYNDLAKQPKIDHHQAELDAYAVSKWPEMTKKAATKTPMTTEKTIAEWVNKVAWAEATPLSEGGK